MTARRLWYRLFARSLEPLLRLDLPTPALDGRNDPISNDARTLFFARPIVRIRIPIPEHRSGLNVVSGGVRFRTNGDFA
jgi:hypothetical protein